MIEALVLITMGVVLIRQWERMSALELRLSAVESRPMGSFPLAAPQSPQEPVPVDEPQWAQRAYRPAAQAAFEPAEVARSPQPPVAEAAAEPEPDVHATKGSDRDDPAPRRTGLSFEDLFGRRLPIWGGGVTLAVAGVLIVRYSIEAGLLSPLVRFLSGLLFGGGLIAAAEVALRNEARVRDARVRQALAGAGIASLYASILVATNLYALIGPVPAFLGLAAVTALSMVLALRFGAPSALLGLVGGLAAPAMVGSAEPNIPLLTLYLTLAVGGLSVVARNQRWMWLGVGALVGAFGWGAALLASGALDTPSSLAIGFYILLVGIGLPLLAAPAGSGRLVRIAGSVVATAQMAALVATGGFALLHWGLFGLISIAIIWLSRREAGLARLPVVGLGIALLLLGVWPTPTPATFALVMCGTTVIYGLPALLALWRQGGPVEAAQIAALSLGAPLLAAAHFFRTDGSNDLALAAVSIGGAFFPAGAALLGWTNPQRTQDGRFALLVSAAAVLTPLAAIFAAPAWSLAPVVAATAALLLLVSLRAEDARLETSGWLFAAAALPFMAATGGAVAELDRLFGEAKQVETAIALLRWAALGAVAALFAWRGRWKAGRDLAQAAGVLLVYGAAAQILPAEALPIFVALGVAALAFASRRWQPDHLLPAMAFLLAICLLWAGLPLIEWLAPAAQSLAGDPVLSTDLPALRETTLRLLLPALLIGAAIFAARRRFGSGARIAAATLVGTMGAVAAHIFYKQVFQIGSGAEFIRLGLAERTLWEALLLAAGLAAWRFGARNAAHAFSAASLAHFGVYTMLLHNPLWDQQAVGQWPLLNLLPLAYGLPLAWLWLTGRYEPELAVRFGRARAITQMLLVLLLGFSMLRQVAEGSILSGPGLSPTEDIARSVLAIALAVGFLLWGIARGRRDWRIASLILMLGAVAKVFLLDASGLEGLMRIASFVALGMSLIGIGWLYSRYLSGDRPRAAA